MTRSGLHPLNARRAAHPDDPAAHRPDPRSPRQQLPQREAPSLRRRLVHFALATTLPLLLLAGGAVWQQHRAERMRAEEALIARAHAMALLLDREFSSAERLLRSLGNAPALARGDLPTFWEEMRTASLAYGARAITLVGPDGRIRLSTSWAPGERRDSQAIGPAQEALALGRTVIGNLHINPSVGEWAVGIAIPMLAPGPDANPRVTHVLGFVLSRDRLAATLAEQRLPAGAVAGVLDRELTVVARTSQDAGTVGSRPPAAALPALQGEAGMVPVHADPEGRPVVTAFAQAPQSGFRVTLALPAEAFEAPLRRALLWMLLPGAGLLAASLGLGMLLAGRLARSLRQVGEAPSHALAGRHAVREIDELAATLTAQSAVRERAAAELRGLFEASPVGVARADAGGRILGANNAFLRIVGMTHADLDAGRIRWDELTPPEWIGRDEAAIAEAVRLGACAPYQKEYVRADGSRVPVLVFFAFDNAATGSCAVFVVDLSGWGATEAALARVHEQMRLAIGAARMFFWDWNIRTGEIEWSEGLEAACGLPPGGFGNSVEAFRSLVDAEDLPRVEAALAAALAGEAEYEVEFRMRRGDGGERWVLARGTVLRDGAGRPTRMVGIDFDITDRKLSELALARHGADIARIAEAGHVATFDVENAASGERDWFSPAYRRLYGLAPDAPCGFDTLAERLHPEDRQRVIETRALRAREGGRIADEFRILLPDGSIRWLQVSGEAEPALDAVRPGRMRGVIFDVTARRQAEAALAASEAQLRQVIEHAPLPMMVHDKAGAILLVNRQWLQASGYPREELPTVTAWLQRAHGEHAAAALATIERSFGRNPDGPPVAGEFPVRTAGGETRIWRFHATDIGQAANGQRMLVTAAIDLTVQSRTESALAESEAQFRGVFEQAAVGIAQVGLDGRWLRVNGRLCAILGYSHAELLGLSFQDVTHPDDLDADLELVQALLEGRRATYTMEKRYRRRDGTLLWASLTVSLLRDAEGSPVHFISVVEDISARRATEAALRENEERLRLAQDAAGIGIWDWDVASDRMRWSPRNGELHGMSPNGAEAVYASWRATVHPDDCAAADAAIAAALNGAGTYAMEYRVRLPDGRQRWLQARGVVLRETDGRAGRMIGVTMDVTAAKTAEAALARDNAELESRVAERTRALTEAAAELRAEMQRREQAQAALVQAQKLEALGQLTGSVAHDFNNVLAAVMGSLRLIARRVPNNEQVLDLARNGERAAERAAALVRQLLAFARREDLMPELIDPAVLLADTDQMLRRAVGSGVALSLGAAPGTWPVLTDPHRLEIALLNLSMNARDAMQGSGTLRVTARNAAPAEPRPPGLGGATDYVVFAVQDSGPGMPAEVLARASEPFFTTKPRGKGTGLGLAMVHGFARQSSGALQLLSTPGEGTTAEIWLPRAGPGNALPPGQPLAEPDPALHGAATLLVVDDDDQVRLVTASQLREMGYAVLEANSVATAMVQALAAERLDLVVTDVTMPGGNGPELARRLRAARPGVPILFLTGFNDRQSLEGEVVLGKPFGAVELGRQVLSALGRLPAPLHDRMLMRLSRTELREAYFAWRRRRETLDRATSGEAGLPWFEADEIAALTGAASAYLVAIERSETASPQLRFLQVGAALAGRPGGALAGRMVDDETEADEVFGGLAAALQRSARLSVPSHDYARYAFQDGGEPIFFERLLLPLRRTTGRGRPTCSASRCFPAQSEETKMTSPALPSFDTPQLAAAIEALPEAMLDRLPFGAIRVDADGIVQVYSGAERRLSGSGERPRLGLDFFTGVAPCMDNPRFRGRIEKALAEGRLDLEFGWTGDFADETRSLRVRVQSAAAGGYWICMLRED